MSAPVRVTANRGHRDLGMTLTELAVSMLVLAVFLVILATTMLSLSRLSRQHADLASAQQSARQSFLVLDKQIRYADAVTAPAVIAGDEWIEWRVPDPTIPPTQYAGQSRCYQWRASGAARLLQYRTWIVPTSGAVSPSGWITVARDVTTSSQPIFTTSATGLAAPPFLLPASVSTYGLAYTRVGVALTISSGPHATTTTTTVFSAPNATTTVPPSVCAEVDRS